MITVIDIACLAIGFSTLLMLVLLYLQGSMMRSSMEKTMDSSILIDALENISRFSSDRSFADLEMKRIARDAIRDYFGEMR